MVASLTFSHRFMEKPDEFGFRWMLLDIPLFLPFGNHFQVVLT